MKFKLNKLLLFKLGSAHVINTRLMYHNLKADDYARKHTTILGKRALRHIICFAICAALAVFLFAYCFTLGFQGKILIMILAIVGGTYAAAYGILFLPLAFNLTIKQMKLNKKFIGKFCLFLLILVLLAFVGLILFIKFS